MYDGHRPHRGDSPVVVEVGTKLVGKEMCGEKDREYAWVLYGPNPPMRSLGNQL